MAALSTRGNNLGIFNLIEFLECGKIRMMQVLKLRWKNEIE
jgi:hypothetical protein